MQRSERRRGLSSVLPAGILAGALLGALLLIVAEFTTLFTVRDAVHQVKSVTSGSHNSYALIPIGLATIVLALAFYRAGSRPALLAVGVLGVVALLIALLGDLPDAHSSGVVGSPSSHFVSASSSAGTGMYMETLGAVLLLLACGVGFLLLGPPAPTRAPRRPAGSPRSAS